MASNMNQVPNDRVQFWIREFIYPFIAFGIIAIATNPDARSRLMAFLEMFILYSVTSFLLRTGWKYFKRAKGFDGGPYTDPTDERIERRIGEFSRRFLFLYLVFSFLFGSILYYVFHVTMLKTTWVLSYFFISFVILMTIYRIIRYM